jgi:hypothetical protein
LNEAVVERSSSVTKSPIASTSTTRSAAGGGNDPFSFDGFGDDEPEGPDAPHVWVRLRANERPEGADFIVDDGHGRPRAVEGRAVANPVPLHRGSVDVNALADAVATRLQAVVRQPRMLPTSRYVTTAHAAGYCDMSVSGFKNAARRGVSPRRGGVAGMGI